MCRNFRTCTAYAIILYQELEISLCAMDYAVTDCKPVFTPFTAPTGLQRSVFSTEACITFEQLVSLLLWIAKHAPVFPVFLQNSISMCSDSNWDAG